jgi:phosphatidylglycerophosphatase A
MVFCSGGIFVFRLFDIWKPYPIDSLQNLPTGIGVAPTTFSPEFTPEFVWH